MEVFCVVCVTMLYLSRSDVDENIFLAQSKFFQSRDI